MSAPAPLAGGLGIRGIEALRRRILAPGAGARLGMADQVLLSLLGIATHQMLWQLHECRPDADALERWIVATAGVPDPAEVARYHCWLDGIAPSGIAARAIEEVDAAPPALDAADLAHWDAHGFVVLREALSRDEAAAAAELLWHHLDARPDAPESWYGPRWQGIWTPVYQAPELDVARRGLRVRKAFAQLWRTADLWTVIDQMGFNPPIRAQNRFRGSAPHWDVSLTTPIPFGTQAILYLNDTPAEQGALRLVPGFHNQIHDWLAVPGNDRPREVPMDGRTVPVPGAAGDLVIWRHELPHGASPNRGALPRLTQYLNMYSPAVPPQARWI